MVQKRHKSQSTRRQNSPYSVRKLACQSPRKTLLIVDDDELVRRTAHRLLQDEWEIFTAQNAIEAVSVIKQNSIDVVLTDYDMPGENGIWLLEEVKRLSPGTHRVLFSGFGPDTLPEHLTSGLVVRFITKPSSRADLFSALSPTF